MADQHKQFSEDMERLLSLIESNLFVICIETVQTREQAVAVKQRFTRALGILNSRFGLAAYAGRKNRPLTKVLSRE